MTTLSQKLRERRKSLGLTRIQIARACDVVESTVVNWETGKHIPRLYPTQMEALCEMLGFTLEELAEMQRQE
ncbi:MAG: helix-turn-helix transcriptional regulator [Leptolyngbyaceae cyanobacterium SM1_3_5]|nr:helix-turn-helix transcriptional regulator [Leptolyngbyaceae cyanobacterium SM1_3_5]